MLHLVCIQASVVVVVLKKDCVEVSLMVYFFLFSVGGIYKYVCQRLCFVIFVI